MTEERVRIHTWSRLALSSSSRARILLNFATSAEDVLDTIRRRTILQAICLFACEVSNARWTTLKKPEPRTRSVIRYCPIFYKSSRVIRMLPQMFCGTIWMTCWSATWWLSRLCMDCEAKFKDTYETKIRAKKLTNDLKRSSRDSEGVHWTPCHWPGGDEWKYVNSENENQNVGLWNRFVEWDSQVHSRLTFSRKFNRVMIIENHGTLVHILPVVPYPVGRSILEIFHDQVTFCKTVHTILQRLTSRHTNRSPVSHSI